MATSLYGRADRIKSHKRPVLRKDLEEPPNKKIRLHKKRVSMRGNISKEQIGDVEVLLEDVTSGVHTVICDPNCVSKHHPLVLSLGVQRDSKMRKCLENYLKLAVKNNWETRIGNDGSCLFAQYPLIHLAVLFGKPKQLEFLINSGFDLVDCTSFSLLHTAVNHVNDFLQCSSWDEKAQIFWQMVEILVKHDSSVLFVKDEINGDSILHLCSRKIRELSLQIKKCGSDDHWDTNRDHLLNQKALFEKCFKMIVEKFHTLCSEGVLCEHETAVLFDSKNSHGETVLQILEDAESVQEVKNYSLVERSLAANVKDIKHLKETSGQQQHSTAVMLQETSPKISSMGRQDSLNCKVIEEPSGRGMQQTEETADGNSSSNLSDLEQPLNKNGNSLFVAELTEFETPEERDLDCDYLRNLLKGKRQLEEKTTGTEYLDKQLECERKDIQCPLVESSQIKTQKKGHETSTSLDESPEHKLKQSKYRASDQLEEPLESDVQQERELTYSSVVESLVTETQEMTGDNSEHSEKLLEHEREQTSILHSKLLESPIEPVSQQKEKESCLSTAESSESERQEITIENSECAEKLSVYDIEDTQSLDYKLLETSTETGLQQKEKENCPSADESAESERQEISENSECAEKLSVNGREDTQHLDCEVFEASMETGLQQEGKEICLSADESSESERQEIRSENSQCAEKLSVYGREDTQILDYKFLETSMETGLQQKEKEIFLSVDESSENVRQEITSENSECAETLLVCDREETQPLDYEFLEPPIEPGLQQKETENCLSADESSESERQEITSENSECAGKLSVYEREDTQSLDYKLLETSMETGLQQREKENCPSADESSETEKQEITSENSEYADKLSVYEREDTQSLDYNLLETLMETGLQQREKENCPSVDESYESERQQITNENSEYAEKLSVYDREDTQILDCELLETLMETGLQQKEREIFLSVDESSESQRQGITSQNSECAEKLSVCGREDTPIFDCELLETPMKTGSQQKEIEICLSTDESSESERQEITIENSDKLLVHERAGTQILDYELLEPPREPGFLEKKKEICLYTAESFESERQEITRENSECAEKLPVYDREETQRLDCELLEPPPMETGLQQKKIEICLSADESFESERHGIPSENSECVEKSVVYEREDTNILDCELLETPMETGSQQKKKEICLTTHESSESARQEITSENSECADKLLVHERDGTQILDYELLETQMETGLQQKIKEICLYTDESFESEKQEITENSEHAEKLLLYEREDTGILDCELLEPPMEVGLQQKEKESCISTDESSESERQEINENSDHAEKLFVYEGENTGILDCELLETPMETVLQEKKKENCLSTDESSEPKREEEVKKNSEQLSELSEECQGEKTLRSLGSDLRDQTMETEMRQQVMVDCESLEELSERYEDEQDNFESSTEQHVDVKGQKGSMDGESFNVAVQADRQQEEATDSRFVDESSGNKKGCEWRVDCECLNVPLESEILEEGDDQEARTGICELPSKLAACESGQARNETSAQHIGKGDNGPVVDSLEDAVREVGGTLPETSAKAAKAPCSGNQGMQQEGLKRTGDFESYQLQKTENSKCYPLLEVPEGAKDQTQSIQGNVTTEKSKCGILEERDVHCGHLHKSLECHVEESRVDSIEDTLTDLTEDNITPLTRCLSPNRSTSRANEENSKDACDSEKSVIAADLGQRCTADTSVKHFDLGKEADESTSNVCADQMSVVCPQPKDVEVPEGIHPSSCTADCSATHHILVQLLCATPDHRSVEPLEAENKARSEFRGYLKKTAWDLACDVPDPCPELQYPIAHLACRLGKYRALEELSEIGFDPLCRCCTGETPLHSLVRLIASESTAYLFLPRVVVNMFKTLSKHSTALSLISAKDGDGCTVLHTLAYIILIRSSNSVVFLYAFVFRILVNFLLSEDSGTRGVDDALQLLETCNNAGHSVSQLLEASVLGRQLFTSVTNLLDALKKKRIERYSLQNLQSKETAVMSDSSGRHDTDVSSNEQTPGSGNAARSTPCSGVCEQMEDDIREGNSCTSSGTTSGSAEPSKRHPYLEDQLEGNKRQSMMLDNSTTEAASNEQGSPRYHSIMEEQLREEECRNGVPGESASEAANGKAGFTLRHRYVKEQLEGMEGYSRSLDGNTSEATKNKEGSSGHDPCMEDQLERMECHSRSLDDSTAEAADNKKGFAEYHPCLEDKLEVTDCATGIFDDSASGVHDAGRFRHHSRMGDRLEEMQCRSDSTFETSNNKADDSASEAHDAKADLSRHHSRMEDPLEGMECRSDSTFQASNNKADASGRHQYVQDQLDGSQFVSWISNDSTSKAANANTRSPGRNPCMEDQLEERGSLHGSSNYSLLEATSEAESPSVHHSCIEEALDANEFSNENSSKREGSSTFIDRTTDGRGPQMDGLFLNGDPETLIDFILSSDWKIAAATKDMVFRRFDEEYVDRIRCIERKMNSTKKEFIAIYNLEMKRNKSETLTKEIKRTSSKIEEKKDHMARVMAQKNELMEQETALSKNIELIDQAILALQESDFMMNRSEELDMSRVA